jgi:hypothetical protein
MLILRNLRKNLSDVVEFAHYRFPQAGPSRASDEGMAMRAKKKAAPRPVVCPDTIDRTRQSYVAMIARARVFDAAPNAMLDKATSLLTAHWGRASWTSRAAILKTVDWLLQVAIHHPAPAPKTRPSQGGLRTGSARA